MLSFAWNNLITRPTRTALAVLGLTIPVLAFLGLFSVSNGIRDLMGGTLEKMQGVMVLRENSPSPVFSDLPAEMVGKLRALPGVRVAAPEVWRLAPPIDGRGALAAAALGLLTRAKQQPPLKSIVEMIVIEGQDIAEHQKLKGAIFPRSLLPKERGGGRFLTIDDIGKPNVVISTKIARDYPNADGSRKSVGQTIQIGPRPFTVVGIYETGSVLIDVTLVMEIKTARELLGLSESMVSTFDVEAVNVADSDALAHRIEAALPGVHAQRISQFNLTVGAIMGKLDLFLLFAVALAVLVGAVGIANTMLMSTSERYVEFGVMRTNGWTRRNILALVTAESALLGVLSGTLGGALAVAAVFAVNRFLRDFSLDLSPWLMVISGLGALAIATVSGLYPAWCASRMTPMDAIRHSGT
jgi:putative ABC transport system permease protein